MFFETKQTRMYHLNICGFSSFCSRIFQHFTGKFSKFFPLIFGPSWLALLCKYINIYIYIFISFFRIWERYSAVLLQCHFVFWFWTSFCWKMIIWNIKRNKKYSGRSLGILVYMTFNSSRDKCDAPSLEFRKEKAMGLEARILQQILSVQIFEYLCTYTHF